MSITTLEDRIKGVLLGQAAGDALGVHYELGIPSHGKAEMLGGGYGFEPGEWSDDTQQALCVAAAKSDLNGTARNLPTWFRSNPPDVGPTSGRVLGQVSTMADSVPAMKFLHVVMTEAAESVARSRGREPGNISNGSLMRTAPVCLPFLGDREKIAAVARLISDLTHYDPYAGDACVLWSLAIDRAITHDGEFDMAKGLSYLPEKRIPFWADVIVKSSLDRRNAPASNLNVVRAFQAALWAVAHHKDYESTVQGAITIGGDTDTIAAIAGGLAGAIYGASAVPHDWRRTLHGWSPTGGRVWHAELERLALEAAGKVPETTT